MASPAEYIIQTQHTSGSTAKHYHGVSISTLNEWAKNNIPKYAVVSSVQVRYSGKCSLGDTYVYVGFSKSSSEEPGDELINAQLTTKQNTWNGNITSYSSTWPFNINTSYSTLSVYMNSGILYKKFTCYDFRVIYNYYIPSYTLTVKAGTGGTVSGGGTVEAGKTATITATANTGYTFKQWNDGNTNASRSITVNGNATYTAEFTPKEYEVTVDCIASVSGERCTVSGAGTYKYGDTVTLKITSMPAYHFLSYWRVSFTNKATNIETETVTFTLDADTIDVEKSYILVDCIIEHTGFKLYANVSPDGSVGTVDYGFYLNDTEYRNIEPIVAEGRLFTYTDSDYVGINAQPSTGYKFVKWQDGNTENPRRLHLTGDVTYTAVFEKITFTVTYQNDDGTVLQTSTVEYGAENPPYIGDEPMKESTVQYHFDFLGWDYEVYYITQDVVYTAVYQKSIRGYDIIVISLPNETNRKTIYPMEMYGSTVTITATHDSGYEFVRWEDGVTTPTRDVVVTGEATYTAYFRVNRLFGDVSSAKKVILNFDGVKKMLMHETLIYENTN